MTQDARVEDTMETASEPFDKPSTADIIFRTSDGVHFYAHKIILSLASTFFEGMFSISQPSPAGKVQETLNGVPVVDVPEDEATLDCMLRYCYPVHDPAVDNFELLDRVLGAVIKYALIEAIELATTTVYDLSYRDPRKAYAISYRHKLQRVALKAAQTFQVLVDLPPPGARSFSESRANFCYTELMEELPAASYYHLMASLDVKYSEVTTTMLFAPLATYYSVKVPLGLDCYPFNQASADITLVSKNDQRFPIHRAVIEMQIASHAVFPLQSLLVPGTSEGTDDAGRPCFRTTETGSVLSELLRLCYPATSHGDAPHWTDGTYNNWFVTVLAAAQRYGLLSVVNTYRSRSQSAISQDPLSLYCITAILGWHLEGHIAAKYMAKHTILPAALSLWLDKLTAKQYHHVLKFWYNCQEAMTEAIAQFVPESESDEQWMDEWYNHSGGAEAKRSPTAVPQLAGELIVLRNTNPIPPTDRVAFSKELIEMSVELEKKLDEAIESVRPRLRLVTQKSNVTFATAAGRISAVLRRCDGSPW